jgi:NAD(P)H-hydrate epimerase
VSRDVPVLSAAQAAATDAATIAAGTPSLTLMERAGAAAVEVIRERHGPLLHHGVRIHTGPGNNGGDGWVVARLLAEQGIPVSVESAADPKTDDARTMCQRAAAHLTSDRPSGARVVVDALLGTGATGEPRGVIAEAIRGIRAARGSGAQIVALDVPSGLDATTGVATLAAPAECTVSFGSAKRGQLIARDLVGALFVVDIGLSDPVGEGTIAGDATLRARLALFGLVATARPRARPRRDRVARARRGASTAVATRPCVSPHGPAPRCGSPALPA